MADNNEKFLRTSSLIPNDILQAFSGAAFDAAQLWL